VNSRPSCLYLARLSRITSFCGVPLLDALARWHFLAAVLTARRMESRNNAKSGSLPFDVMGMCGICTLRIDLEIDAQVVASPDKSWRQRRSNAQFVRALQTGADTSPYALGKKLAGIGFADCPDNFQFAS
jgi:hypothetical protein